MRAYFSRIISPYKLLLPLCFGVFIAADDQTVVVTLLPEMLSDLRVGVNELDRASWSITGYLIGYTAAMPLMGRISDRTGYRSSFLLAMVVFTIGSSLVALSPEIPRLLYGGDPQYNWLVGARVFQAIGGGALIPITIAASGELVNKKHRAIAYGMIGASAEAGAVTGPLWGGGITTLLSWQWAFWLNIPLALLVIIFVLRIPKGNQNSKKVDFLAASIFAAALTTSTLGLIRIGNPDALMSGYLATAVILVTVLVILNRRAENPLFPKYVFKIASSNYSNLTHFLIGAVIIIGMITVPLMAASVFGKSTLEGGLQLLRLTIAIGAGAIAGGYLTRSFGARTPALVGLLISAGGFMLLSSWTTETKEPEITAHLICAGLGLGMLVSPITESALWGVSTGERGAASALLSVSRMSGMTAGLAVITALGTMQFTELVVNLPAFSLDINEQKQIVKAASDAGFTVFTNFYRYAAVLLVIAIVPAWFMTINRSDI